MEQKLYWQKQYWCELPYIHTILGYTFFKTFNITNVTSVSDCRGLWFKATHTILEKLKIVKKVYD